MRPAVVDLIERTESEAGAIDLWCGNAGIGANGGVELDNDTWNANWNVNVMAHVIAARHLVPRWIERGGGHLLLTASAAGLITNLGTAPYAVTKHGCVALAEWDCYYLRRARYWCFVPVSPRRSYSHDRGRRRIGYRGCEGHGHDRAFPGC